MAEINQELIDKISETQTTIWESASATLAESGAALEMGSPLAVVSKVTDLGAELTGPMGLIQFSFAHAPDTFQLVVIPQSTLVDMANLVSEDPVVEVDENALSLVRPSLEAIVQGMCLGVGNLRDTSVAASGLTIRYQDVTFPPNFEALDELIRVQIAINGDGVKGAVMWLMDPATAAFVSGADEAEGLSEGPFQQIGTGMAPMSTGHSTDGAGALDFLMDIPLEITVELGRVRMLVRDVVELGTGSIVEVDKAAGEPVDVMVNGRLVAKGEVVVIEDNFAVRITEIVTPQERLMRLAEVA